MQTKISELFNAKSTQCLEAYKTTYDTLLGITTQEWQSVLSDIDATSELRERGVATADSVKQAGAVQQSPTHNIISPVGQYIRTGQLPESRVRRSGGSVDRLSMIRESKEQNRESKERVTKNHGKSTRDSRDGESVSSVRSSHASDQNDVVEDDDALYEEDFEPHDEEHEGANNREISHMDQRDYRGAEDVNNSPAQRNNRKCDDDMRGSYAQNVSEQGPIKGAWEADIAESTLSGDGGSRIGSAPRRKFMDEVVGVPSGHTHTDIHSLSLPLRGCISMYVCMHKCVYVCVAPVEWGLRRGGKYWLKWSVCLFALIRLLFELFCSWYNI
jgi:hypothetical protein